MPQQLRAALLHHPQPITTPAFLLQPTISLLLTRPRVSASPTPTPSSIAALSTQAREPHQNVWQVSGDIKNNNNNNSSKKNSDTSSGPDNSRGSGPPPPVPKIPPPTPFVPNVQTFLTLIGRGLGQHASKFPTWESLFSLTSEQLRELGIEPPRTRRYLLQWRQRFRRRQYGVGGDLQHVKGGAALLRVLELGTFTKRRYVVNVPPDTQSLADLDPSQMSRVTGYKVQGARTIVGPYALPLPLQATPLSEGGAARVTVTEGMWEFRRGRKIDGGERRRTEVRYKKRIAERRELREQGLL